MTARERRLVKYLRERKYAYPVRTVRAIRKTGINFAEALVLLRKESGGGRNVFGCDHGPQQGNVPYCGDKVTKKRVIALKESKFANGVGPTQLTFKPFLKGPVWRPYHNMVVGFTIFQGYRKDDTVWASAKRYNGGVVYADDFVNMLDIMKKSLRKAGL